MGFESMINRLLNCKHSYIMQSKKVPDKPGLKNPLRNL